LSQILQTHCCIQQLQLPLGRSLHWPRKPAAGLSPEHRLGIPTPEAPNHPREHSASRYASQLMPVPHNHPPPGLEGVERGPRAAFAAFGGGRPS
jgi:hypothetical protein